MSESRRAFLHRAAPGARLAAVADPDVRALTTLLALERVAVHTCTELLERRRVSGRAAAVASTVLADERAHAGALGQALAARPARLAPVAAAQGLPPLARVSQRAGEVRDQGGALALLLDLEQLAIGAYRLALGRLQNPALVRLAAEILADEAQHASALRLLRRHAGVSDAAPDAFPAGHRWAPPGGW